MNRDIEFLDGVWTTMMDAGLVQSKSQFSTQMLGKAPSYLTSMTARDRNVPFEVFDNLLEAVKDSNEAERQARDDLESRLLTILRRQRVREDLISSIIDHQCDKSEEALDAIIDGNVSDTFLSRFLKQAGLTRLA